MGLDISGSPLLDTLLRLGLAALLGGLIGMDREASGKPAGFRTNILICIGAALLTQLSIDIADRWMRLHDSVADPERIAAQIVSGIGFLGAGTILQSRHGIRGLTTAATIWVVAAIGMAVGGGAYFLAISGAIGVVVTLALLGRVETWLEPKTLEERWIRVVFRHDDPALLERVQALLAERHMRIRAVDVERREDALRVGLRVEARAHRYEGIIDVLLRDGDVTRASLE